MTERILHMTPKAREAAQKQLIKRGTSEAYLRVGIKGGSCSGYSYVIEFADEKRERDIEFVFDTTKVLVDPKSLVLLDGATLDYESKLLGGGFKFRNPNAASSCGCGESFDIRADSDSFPVRVDIGSMEVG